MQKTENVKNEVTNFFYDKSDNQFTVLDRIEKCYKQCTGESMFNVYNYKFEQLDKCRAFTFKRTNSETIKTEKFCQIMDKEFGEDFVEMYCMTSNGLHFTLYIR